MKQKEKNKLEEKEKRN